jgi:hypothetical protein
MERKLIHLTIDEMDDETRVEKVSFVDDPAIKRDWMAFSKQPHAFKIQDADRRIVSGALMVAGQPIYRRAKDGEEYYVLFSADAIKKIVYKFMREGRLSEVNQMHETDVKDVFMFESFIIDATRGIKTPEGFEELPDGSWFGSFKVDDDETWAKVKDGTFRGFSVEGIFDEAVERTMDERIIREIMEQISGANGTL